MDSETQQKLRTARAQHKTIGLVQGSWDMFHLGHLCYLQEARKQCDFLIVAMDDDEKIRFRKGNNRPIIPLEERYATIEKLGIADALVVKHLSEPHWGLIKAVKPDVLIAIKENYSDADLQKLQKICGRVAVLPRQATTSTSDIIRRTLIKNGVKALSKKDPRVRSAVKSLKDRLHVHDHMPVPLPEMFQQILSSTDPVVPNVACCFSGGRWYFGVNQIDQSLPKNEIERRTELFYSTVEHAEINLLKKLEHTPTLDMPIFCTLCPCDKCLKVLIDKGAKDIRYLEDHPDRNWSKRTHALAKRKGVKLTQITVDSIEPASDIPVDQTASAEPEFDPKDFSTYKYGDPRNAREQKQLDIMIQNERSHRDPFAPNEIDQTILLSYDHWYVSENRFPYEGVEHQFLIIARDDIYSPDQVTTEMWAELKVIFDRLRQSFSISGGALCFRFGDTLRSGASLKRLHLHLIVPESGAKTKFGIGGNLAIKEELKI